MTALLPPPRAPVTASIGPVPAALAARMRGGSWRDDPRCPPFAELALVELAHVGFDGAPARGALVVARAIAADTVALFRRLYALGFPIRAIAPVDDHGADDDRAMAADACTGFNFRVVAGTQILSQHAHGLAIDINPVENPWVTPQRFVPPVGAPYLDRGRIRPGMIVRPGPVTAVLDELGWEWGGDWRHAADYHHIVRRAG